MGFKKLPGNLGMIYVPECNAGRKKYTCPDCFACQWCSNERCRVCRDKVAGKKQGRCSSGRTRKRS